MFSDSTADVVVSFPSFANETACSQDAEAQTDQCTYGDVDCQTVSTCSSGAQTDSDGHNAPQTPEVDYDRLAVFLRGVCPQMLKELDKATRSRAFIGYRPIEDDDGEEVKSIYALLTPELKAGAEVKVGSLAWSCSGGALAIGYSHRGHEGWCNHSGAVHLFYISRQDFSPSSPGRSLETSSCVTCLAAHPSEPSILAVGTFSGEVAVWNLQSDTEVLVGCSAGSHQEAVSQLCWVHSTDPAHSGLLLASAGRDGRVFLWRVGTAPGSLSVADGFVVTLEHCVGRGSKVQASPLGGRACAEVGVTSFGFSPHEPGSFVVGLEGGGLLRCSTLLAKQSSVSSEVPLKDPVLTAYEGHRGAVTCVRHSVQNKDLFLSCDATEIHVHNLDQVSPLRVIHPVSEVLGLEWWDSHPCLFWSWGPAGTLEPHSISCSEEAPGSVVLLASERSFAPVVAICFGPRWVHQLVAVGDVEGRIAVLKVPRAKDLARG